MMGIVSSAFGLSAFVFSSIARKLFPGETGAFLTVLVAGTSVPVLVGASVFKAEPERLASVERSDVDEETPLLPGVEDFIHGERGRRASEEPGLENAVPKGLAGMAEDVHGLELFKSTDFWVTSGVAALCESVSSRSHREYADLVE